MCLVTPLFPLSRSSSHEIDWCAFNRISSSDHGSSMLPGVVSIWPVSKRKGIARARTLACVPIGGISSRSPLYTSMFSAHRRRRIKGNGEEMARARHYMLQMGNDALLANLILLQCGGSDQVQPVKSHKSRQRYQWTRSASWTSGQNQKDYHEIQWC